jgi:hypothetical protein
MISEVSEFDPVVASTKLFGTTGDDGMRNYRYTDVVSANIEGLLGAVIKQSRAGQVALDNDAQAMLQALINKSASQSVVLESRAAAAVSLLRARCIETRVLKGAAVAHIDYGDPALRPFGDIDLLVRGSDMASAVEALADVGFTRHYAEPFNGFDEHIGKGVAVEDRDGTVFDLHRTLALGYYGTRLPIDDLWQQPTAFEIARVEMSALPRLRRFVHCALHMALAPIPKIANALDLCVIGGGPDPLATSDILKTAGQWGCLRPLAIAVESTCALFGDSWAPNGMISWAREHRTPITDRLAMAAFVGPLSSSRLRSLTSIAGLRSTAMRRRALRGVIMRGHHGHS